MAKSSNIEKTEEESQKAYFPLFKQSENNNSNPSDINDESISNFRRVLSQIIAVNIQNLLQFGYGLTQGFPTIAIPAIQSSQNSTITLNNEQISWLSSINLICMPLGCLFSGMFAQYLGKRRAMQLINLPILAAWLLFHYATCTEHMYLALCFIGIGAGLMEAAVITYVAEISGPKYRGIFSASETVCVSLGVSAQFLLGSLTDWRTAALISTVIPLLSIIMLCFVPESPVWLIREQRFSDAVKSLQWLRGWVPEHKVEAEFRQLYDELITKKSTEKAVEEDVPSSIGHTLKMKLHMWHKRSFIVPFLLVLLTFFICHFSGKTPIRTYSVLIFETLKAPIDKNKATIILGISELMATILGAVLIHSTGKRPLVFTSMWGTGACVLGIAIYAHLLNINELTGIAAQNDTVNTTVTVLKEHIPQLLNTSMQVTTMLPDLQLTSELRPVNSFISWTPLFLILFAAFFANLGIRMIPWVLMGEVFPAEIRSTASGFCGLLGHVFGFLANKLFLLMISLMTLPGTFLFYASVSFICVIILYFFMPETEGYTLGEIEAHFSKKSDVNLLLKTRKKVEQRDANEIKNII